MRLALTCPHCESNSVDTVRQAWFIHGFVLVARYGRRTLVGCRSCVIRKLLLNALGCLVLGWWCIPWGLGTPIVLLQNLLVLLFPPSTERQRARLAVILEDSGISMASIELDDDGFTAETRALTDRLCTVLHAAIAADAVQDPAELECASRLLSQFTGGLLSEDRARARILCAQPQLENPSLLDYDERIILLQAAVTILGSDGTFSQAERRFAEDIGRRLGFPPAFVERSVLEIVFGVTSDESPLDPDLALACSLLGVGPAVTFAEVRKKYREVMLRHHPDVAGRHGVAREEAEEIAKRLNWAYDVLKRHTAPAASAA